MFTLMAKGNASSLTKAKRHLPVVVVHLLLRKHFQFHKLIQHVDEYRDESKRRFPQGMHQQDNGSKMADLLSFEALLPNIFSHQLQVVMEASSAALQMKLLQGESGLQIESCLSWYMGDVDALHGSFDQLSFHPQ
ncbi:uncharacterized protein LOC144009009 isoform X2 [Festucalex cinctus]